MGRMAQARNRHTRRLSWVPGSLVYRRLWPGAAILSQFSGVNAAISASRNHESRLALIGSFADGDLLDHLDNAAPELGIRDARERAG
jgi:hypothetical protein